MSEAGIVQKPGAAAVDTDGNRPLQVRDVGISNTAVGILALDTPALILEASLIQKVEVGIIVVAALKLNVSTNLLSDVEKMGFFIQDSPGTGSCDGNQMIIENKIYGGKEGGIAVLRSGVCIRNNTLLYNRAFGIGIFSSAAVIENNQIVGTLSILSGESAGYWGDGVVIWSLGGPALAAVANNDILLSDRVQIWKPPSAE